MEGTCGCTESFLSSNTFFKGVKAESLFLDDPPVSIAFRVSPSFRLKRVLSFSLFSLDFLTLSSQAILPLVSSFSVGGRVLSEEEDDLPDS